MSRRWRTTQTNLIDGDLTREDWIANEEGKKRCTGGARIIWTPQPSAVLSYGETRSRQRLFPVKIVAILHPVIYNPPK